MRKSKPYHLRPRRVRLENRQRLARHEREVKKIPYLDKEIRELIALLWTYGFRETRWSCAGHPEKLANPSSGPRRCFPYVILRGDEALFRKLERIIENYNMVIDHPYQPDGERYELCLHPRNLYGSLFSQVRETELRQFATLANCSVFFVEEMPLELLTDDFRATFLERTRKEMQNFTKFLRWSLDYQLL